MAATKDSRTISSLKLSVAAYTLIFLLKLSVFLASGVFVVLAEALHSLSDIIISALLLGAAFYARKEADDKHMFGHGRVHNVAAFFAATLFVSIMSFELYNEALHELFHPETHHFTHVPYVIALFIISIAICAVPITKILIQKQWDATIKAQFVALIKDELSMLAALVGAFFVMKGYAIADSIATIVVATIIAASGLILLFQNFSYLLGLSPEPEILARIEEIAQSVPGVLGIHALRAEYVGPNKIHADMHIRVKREQSVEDAHSIAEKVQRKIEEEAGCPYCIVHVDPEV